VRIPDLPDAAAFAFMDQLTDERFAWERDDLDRGLYVRLEAGGAHLFFVEAA
jgi:hypothetical protein